MDYESHVRVQRRLPQWLQVALLGLNFVAVQVMLVWRVILHVAMIVHIHVVLLQVPLNVLPSRCNCEK